MDAVQNISLISANSQEKSRVSLVDYTLGEELVNAISHGAGTLLAVLGTILCMVKAMVAHSGPLTIAALSIYGFTLIMLYIVSTLYHSLSPKSMAKRVFRVLDHCSVFMLIAGTYTPFLLISLHGARAWMLFGFIWISCVLGVVFNSIDVDKYQSVSAIINVVMGWAIVFDYTDLAKTVVSAGIWLLVAGGVAYTLGAILYALGDKIRYMHSVWHFFVLAGSILQFLCIYEYVL